MSMQQGEEPLVSVVMPTYNGAATIEQALGCVLGQTLESLELIVVDDGSTDATPALLARAAAEDARVRVLRQENQGAAAARNNGIAAARGTFLICLDDDDLFEPHMLQRMAELLQRDGADLCVCDGWRYDAALDERYHAKPYLRRDYLPGHVPFAPAELGAHLFDFTTFFAFNKMCRLELVKANNIRFGAYPTSEDALYTVGLLLAAQRITIADEPLFTYRAGTGGSLYDTVSGDILAGWRAMREVRQLLVQRGVYEGAVKQGFVNRALGHVFDNLKHASTYESVAEWHAFMVEQGFAQLDILGHGEEYFFNKGAYTNLQLALGAESGGAFVLARYRQAMQAGAAARSKSRALQGKLATQKQRNAKLQGRVEKLQERNAKLQGRVEKLQERTGKLQSRNTKLQARNERLSAQLARIEGSRSWRLACWLHRIARKLHLVRG